MAPFVFLLFLLSEATSVIVVTVHPGDDVTLPCEAADVPVRAVEWTRPDLEPDNVLFCSDGYLETEDQNLSFKDRVDLVDRELKDGDMSLILKNANKDDQGIYECRVEPADLRRKKRANINSEPISTVRLQVPEPADPNSENFVDGNYVDENTMNDGPNIGRYTYDNFPRGYVGLSGFAAPLLTVVLIVVVGVYLKYKRSKNKRSMSAADDVQLI